MSIALTKGGVERDSKLEKDEKKHINAVEKYETQYIRK